MNLFSREGEMKRDGFELPVWVPEEAWDGWEDMRKKTKRPLTLRARQMAVRMLAELRDHGYEPELVLDQSTFMGWAGLFPLRDQKPANNVTPKVEPMMSEQEFEKLRQESDAMMQRLRRVK